MAIPAPTGITRRTYRPRLGFPASFWARVEKTDGCWRWNGTTNGDYGTIWNPRMYRTMFAHRLSWEMAFGAIPDGMWVLHRCDRPLCVRPEHLFLGDVTDNMRDMVAKGRGLVGELNGQSRLTSAIVLSARDRHRNGESINSLAREFSVSGQTMGKAVRGVTWKRAGETVP